MYAIFALPVGLCRLYLLHSLCQYTSVSAYPGGFLCSEFQFIDRGLRLSGTGGRSPKKFEVGGSPMHPSPNILRTSVIGCEAKYELTKKIFRRNFGL